jgi:rhodanese-related sulfurtransferase
VLSYDPPEAHQLWAAGELRIIDCREPYELSEARIEGVEHIPMSRFAEHVDAIPEDLPLAILCRSGSRSARVAYALEQTGRFGEDLPYEGDPPT